MERPLRATGPYGSSWGYCLLRGGQANIGNIVDPSPNWVLNIEFTGEFGGAAKLQLVRLDTNTGYENLPWRPKHDVFHI